MIEKAIENWLINTNELNYQLAFCQILLLKGEKVIYNSSHRPMEQGKDIITINSDGNCCAYQLKTGNINLKEWRNISGEIRDLMELPIIHPSANKKVPHEAFLVTNGEINDEVRFQIDQMNSDNEKKGRNFSYLDVITKDVLLKEFIDAQGKFMPKELEDFHLFLELFLNDGADFLPKEKYFTFLHRTIFQEIPKRKSDTINTVLSSIIINSYLLNPYQREKNYYALFEAWTLLGGFIITYSINLLLKKNYWIESLNLIFDEITRNLSLLKEEVLKKDNFIEGNPLADGGMIYNARMTIVLGILSTFEIHLHKTRTEYNQDKKILELIKENIGKFFFWGESAFPFFFFTIKYLELIGEDEIAYDLLKKIFFEILTQNSPRSQMGLPSPYYTIKDILETKFGHDPHQINFRNFPGSSYILEILVLMFAKRNERGLLEENWREISHIENLGFRPDNIAESFLWHAEKGTNYSEFPKATQSWNELKKESENTGTIPSIFLKYKELLRFFIVVCPHRVNKSIIKMLEND